MNEALQHLTERKKYYGEQIKSYNDYVEAAMNTMQKGERYVQLEPNAITQIRSLA